MKTRIIGIVIALESELYKFKSIFENNFSVHISLKQKFYITYCKNNMFIFVFSGVGKTNASMTALNLIKTFNPHAIINFGLCGSCNKDILINDIYLINNFYYLDVDATSFKYELGQVPREIPFFTSNHKLNEKIIKIFNDNNIKFKIGKCGTSDSFINKVNFKKLNNQLMSSVECIDMESTSIAHVCYKTNVAFASIKIVSDNVNHQVNNNQQFNDNLVEISKMITTIVNLIINNAYIN